MTPTKEQVIEQVEYAFREHMLQKGIMGLKASRALVGPLFEEFKKSLQWRIEQLYKK